MLSRSGADLVPYEDTYFHIFIHTLVNFLSVYCAVSSRISFIPKAANPLFTVTIWCILATMYLHIHVIIRIPGLYISQTSLSCKGRRRFETISIAGTLRTCDKNTGRGILRETSLSLYSDPDPDIPSCAFWSVRICSVRVADCKWVLT